MVESSDGACQRLFCQVGFRIHDWQSFLLPGNKNIVHNGTSQRQRRFLRRSIPTTDLRRREEASTVVKESFDMGKNRSYLFTIWKFWYAIFLETILVTVTAVYACLPFGRGRGHTRVSAKNHAVSRAQLQRMVFRAERFIENATNWSIHSSIQTNRDCVSRINGGELEWVKETSSVLGRLGETHFSYTWIYRSGFNTMIVVWILLDRVLPCILLQFSAVCLCSWSKVCRFPIPRWVVNWSWPGWHSTALVPSW